MPKWLKYGLIIFSVMILLCGVSSVLTAWSWYGANKDKLKGVSERAKKEGAAFAFNHDDEACLDEALRRLSARSGIIDQAEHKLFLKACLEKAARSPGFCTSVPPRSEIMAFAQWAVERCAAKGKTGDQDCSRLMQSVQEACQSGS
ncbi:MAG: hypothetical protein Q8K32_27080 [Archangium sp.]|nr:hypothetical protein [Archangium sp.]